MAHSSHYVALWPKVPYLPYLPRVCRRKLAASESFESRKQQLKGKLSLISLIGGCCAGFSMSHLSAGSNSPGHRKQGHMDLKLEIDALEIGFMKVTLQRLEKCQLMLASCSFMCSMS